MESVDASAPYRVGQWLPSDHAFLACWLEAMIHKSHAEPRPLHPVIGDFRDLIESDPAVFMLFNQMFEQVPRRPPFLLPSITIRRNFRWWVPSEFADRKVISP